MLNKFIQNYFLVLFSLIPISIILGSSISLFNILLIDISFVIFLIFHRDFSFIRHESIKYLFLLYLYLIFNSLISVNFESGIFRNLGFIRIIILFVAINYFFKDNKFLNKVLSCWLLIITFVSIDILVEVATGKNLIGYGELYGRRVVSFFKDEPIVGGYINSFYLILIGFLFYSFKKDNKNLILFFSIFLFLSIFLTGERSNSIKALLAFLLFYGLLKEYNFKQKIGAVVIFIIFLTTFIFNSEYFKTRYVNQIKTSFSTNQVYLELYKSGFKVFKDNPFFGVGNKNYRIVACDKISKENTTSNDDYICNTHPHQIYFEFLSEHGIIGTLIVFYIFYKLIFLKLIRNINSLNYIQLGSSIFIVVVFTPIIPSGSFFNDYSITLFSLNLSIFYAANPLFNIFNSYKNNIK